METNRPVRQVAGSVRRIVVGSLLTGAVLAGILTMVVFGGAQEPVVTGAALVGFGVGWAMVAVLSARRTNQPQRWALVPAAAMAVTGVGLIVLQPGNDALTAAGWVWPPAMLALAVWIGVRVRRSLSEPRSGCWALYPVVLLMAAAAVGGMVTTAATAFDDRLENMPGQIYDVGGHRLHLDCAGAGSPTVVLQSGQGEISAHWSLIASAASRTTRVCAYDRAGQAWSDDVPQPQDAHQVAADLRTLLNVAGEDGPYVLVGHSIGGAHAMTYAARYREQVAGMVLLDSSNLYQTPADTVSTAGNLGPIALLPSLARLGLGYLLPASDTDIPEPAASQVEAFGSSPRSWRNSRDEFATMPELFGRAQQLTTLGSTPLVVFTATGEQHAEGFTDAHDRMAALSSNSAHRFTDATHAGVLVDEQGAEASTRAINDVVQAVRTSSPLPG
jgi:pimeloyl-ACP methyl ester carboxylesterase